MKLKVINDNILYLSFSTQKELTMTLFRPQEYYECDNKKLRGNYFSIETFLNHYIDDSGCMSYFSYWSGFNIPGLVLEEFFTKFNPLHRREIELREITKKFSDTNYYLVATKKNDKETLEHELLHAYYYLNHEYKQRVNTLVKHMRPELRKEMTARLKSFGYNQAVIVDEINAYIASSTLSYLVDEMDLKCTKKDLKPFKELAKTVL